MTEQSAVGRSASPGDVVPLPEYGSGCEVGDILVCATVGGSSLIAAGRIDVARCRD